MLFITAVLLTGVLLILPPYINENRTTAVVVYVRDSASNACAYLNTGVIMNGSEYQPLDNIIKANNYTYGGFQVTRIDSTETADRIVVNVTITYLLSGLPKASLEGNITKFIEDDLVSKTNVRKGENGKLYLSGKEVEINVTAVRR